MAPLAQGNFVCLKLNTIRTSQWCLEQCLILSNIWQEKDSANPTTETQCQQYLSCYWPDLDETLKVGSCEHLNRFQLSGWHLSMQHLPSHHLSISGISQLLLTRFWWNFKDRFLGTSRTYPNYHGDICQGNICLGDIVHIRNISTVTDLIWT